MAISKDQEIEYLHAEIEAMRRKTAVLYSSLSIIVNLLRQNAGADEDSKGITSALLEAGITAAQDTLKEEHVPKEWLEKLRN